MSDTPESRPGMTRRTALLTIGGGALAVGAGYALLGPLREKFEALRASGEWTWRVFTPAEVETMRPLADMIIPADETSGSATDAGTLEYADFVLSESNDDTRDAWHTGLTWLTDECRRRYEKAGFAACSDTERAAILDDIAWPARAEAPFQDAAKWFTRVRDLIGSGFFSSRAGVADLGYLGGVFNPGWNGAPLEALKELNVTYAEWDKRYGRGGAA